MKVKAIAITFRPKHGITDEHISKILHYCIPRCKYYAFITEKTGEARHLHGALFLHKEIEPKYFNRAIKKSLFSKIITELNDGTNIRAAYHGSTIYNDDFVTRYLEKDDDTEQVGSYLPDKKEEREVYYTDVREFKRPEIGDYVHDKFEKSFYEEYDNNGTTVNTDEIEEHLCNLMYVERTWRCIRDPRKMKQLVWSLWSYMNKRTTYYYHSNVSLHPDLLYGTTTFTCQACGYTNSTTKPTMCSHI